MHPFFGPLVFFFSLVVITGCGVVARPVVNRTQGNTLQGRLQGGQQPISGAHIYLFAANTSGYGEASVSLLDAATTGHSDSVGAYVLTDSGGSFTITGNYACAPDSQVYVYALGGNPGAGTNIAAGLLAVLGNCPAAHNFGSATFVAVNEVTTVAAAYSMSGYAVDATHVASSGTALARNGIANAFATAGNLASPNTGVALSTTLGGNGHCSSNPDQHLGQHHCGLCQFLWSRHWFSKSDTVLPAFPERNCGRHINGHDADGNSHGNDQHRSSSGHKRRSSVLDLRPANAPFAPALSQVPNDFGESITYRSQPSVPNSVAFSPKDIGIDGLGNVWLANYTSSSVIELSPLGVILSPPAGFVGGGVYRPTGIAIDASNDVWVSNSGQGSGSHSFGTVSKFTNTGAPLSPAGGFTGGGLIGAGLRIAIDDEGSASVVNGGARGRMDEAGERRDTRVAVDRLYRRWSKRP